MIAGFWLLPAACRLDASLSSRQVPSQRRALQALDRVHKNVVRAVSVSVPPSDLADPATSCGGTDGSS